jgi:hypothetical protein
MDQRSASNDPRLESPRGDANIQHGQPLGEIGGTASRRVVDLVDTRRRHDRQRETQDEMHARA